MMLTHRIPFLAAPLLALSIALAPSAAYAGDEVGAQGVATKVEVLTPSADTYLQYNGRLFVGADEYRWGGASCGSRTLSNENVDHLQQAVRNGMLVTPNFQLGQGTAKCLVGFTLERAGR